MQCSPLSSQSSVWWLFLSGSTSLCTLLLFTRWSWRGSVGEAGVARWLWTTSPWGKAPARRSTIWGDSDWQNRERRKENKRENHLKENWLCCDNPSLCLGSRCSPPTPFPHPSQPSCERYPKNCASAEQWISLSWLSMNKKTESNITGRSQQHTPIFSASLSLHHLVTLKPACTYLPWKCPPPNIALAALQPHRWEAHIHFISTWRGDRSLTYVGVCFCLALIL